MYEVIRDIVRDIFSTGALLAACGYIVIEFVKLKSTIREYRSEIKSEIEQYRSETMDNKITNSNILIHLDTLTASVKELKEYVRSYMHDNAELKSIKKMQVTPKKRTYAKNPKPHA